MQANAGSVMGVLFGLQALRLNALMIILIIASVRDIRTRTIPDLLPVLIAAVSLIPTGHPYVLGVLVAMPLLMAGVVYGGIGGGDVKTVGAVGIVLGFRITLAGLILALIFMLAFHLIRKMPVFSDRKSVTRCIQNEDNVKKKTNDSYPMIPFLTAGMFAAYCLNICIF